MIRQGTRTVGTPIMMGSAVIGGTTAPGSMIWSVRLVKGCPPTRTVMHPGGAVMPGPCGDPGPAGGGALTTGHVCWSVTRQAGLFPISTVGHPAPSTGGPCIGLEVIVAAGNGIASYGRFNKGSIDLGQGSFHLGDGFRFGLIGDALDAYIELRDHFDRGRLQLNLC